MSTELLAEPKIPVSKSLDGKVALVTGASRGIGRAIALELADRGATVAITFRTGLSGAEVVRDGIRRAGGESDLFQCGISDKLVARKVVKKVIDAYKRLDILVNNAGITRDKSVRQITDDDCI